MPQTFEKLIILWQVFIYPAIDDWKREVWRRDLDESYCCIPCRVMFADFLNRPLRVIACRVFYYL